MFLKYICLINLVSVYACYKKVILLFYFAPLLYHKQQGMAGHVHGLCTQIRLCKLLII